MKRDARRKSIFRRCLMRMRDKRQKLLMKKKKREMKISGLKLSTLGCSRSKSRTESMSLKQGSIELRSL